MLDCDELISLVWRSLLEEDPIQGLTNLTLGMPFCNFNSPWGGTITAIKNSSEIVDGWKDLSIVEDFVKESMLISKSNNFVLRNGQLTLGPTPWFAIIDTSSAGAK
jgi:hypothetical protein